MINIEGGPLPQTTPNSALFIKSLLEPTPVIEEAASAPEPLVRFEEKGNMLVPVKAEEERAPLSVLPQEVRRAFKNLQNEVARKQPALAPNPSLTEKYQWVCARFEEDERLLDAYKGLQNALDEAGIAREVIDLSPMIVALENGARSYQTSTFVEIDNDGNARYTFAVVTVMERNFGSLEKAAQLAQQKYNEIKQALPLVEQSLAEKVKTGEIVLAQTS